MGRWPGWRYPPRPGRPLSDEILQYARPQQDEVQRRQHRDIRWTVPDKKQCDQQHEKRHRAQAIDQKADLARRPRRRLGHRPQCVQNTCGDHRDDIDAEQAADHQRGRQHVHAGIGALGGVLGGFEGEFLRAPTL